MTHPIKNKIIISPIGDYSDCLLTRISTEIQRNFTLQTEIIRILDNVDFAFHPQRRQYHSTLILNKLCEVAPLQAFKILAITRMDLFIPILTHVYGEAQLGGKACVISVCRLTEGILSNEEAFLNRVAKEAIHELGHTFNLTHCKDHSCVMHYCRDIQDVDRKSNNLCRYCKILLDDDLKRNGLK